MFLGTASCGGHDHTDYYSKFSAPPKRYISADACPVTVPNGSTPPGERASPRHHGNGSLWVAMHSIDGTLTFEKGGPGFHLTDGTLTIKFPWWRSVPGDFGIEGRRLDGPAPPLRAAVPRGYAKTGFQVTGLVFPTEGCWEVTGLVVGVTHLTFVTRVINKTGVIRGTTPVPKEWHR